MNAKVDDLIPTWTMDSVSAERMRTAAAIFRDPNPIHWDRDAAEAQGFGPRVVNQGPVSLGYVANMVMAWAGPASIRRLTSRFTAVVQEGDRMTAGGKITALEEDTDGVTLANCEVWLDHEDGRRAIEGTALVDVSELD